MTDSLGAENGLVYGVFHCSEASLHGNLSSWTDMETVCYRGLRFALYY